MLIFSTTLQMMAVSSEIGGYLSKPCSEFEHMISDKKIHQLRRLTWSTTLLYCSAALLVLSGLLGAVLHETSVMALPDIILYLAAVLVFIALAILINYGFHTINIRELPHAHSHKKE
ncbi:MAG: hypothetical protein AAF824_22635 [Bacteroidota bacterium]